MTVLADSCSRASAVALDASGNGTLTITLPNITALGSHSTSGVYSGDFNFSGNTSGAVSQVVQCEPAGVTCLGAAGHQILQPINSDGSSVRKQARTVPAQSRVRDANAKSSGTAGAVSS